MALRAGRYERFARRESAALVCHWITGLSGCQRGLRPRAVRALPADPARSMTRRAQFFRTWTPPVERRRGGSASPRSSVRSTRASSLAPVNLAESIRRYGHLAARHRSARQPAGRRPSPAARDARRHRSRAQARAGRRSSRGPAAGRVRRRCGMWSSGCAASTAATTGYDIAHIFVPEERQWLREAIETGRYRAPADPIDPVALLDRLTDVEVFERFLHRTFPGKTRFSIEGLDMLVPILDEVLSEAAEAGLRQAFIGMAHRGRLNVMAHVMGKPYEQILAEFKDPVRDALDLEGVQWSRRRQVPPRRVARDQRRRRGRSGRVDAAEPEPSRSDQSGARGHGARGRHRRAAAPGRRRSIRTPCCPS